MNNSLVSRAVAAFLLCAGASLYAEEKETVRPEVGKPLQAAQELLKASRAREALAEIGKADAVANKTPYESYVVERMRASAAAGTGDVATAVKAIEAVIASGRALPAERLPMYQALAGSYYRQKDYAKAIAWTARYYSEGGTDPQLRPLLVHSYYQNGEYDHASQEALADIQAEERAGKVPAESSLQILANSYLKQNDQARYQFALEKLVTYHPKKEYWADLIARAQRNTYFASRLAVDVQRLKLAVAQMDSAEEYLELAQNSLTAGYPGEAKAVVDKGYAVGVLGTGANAERHKRMRERVEKAAAEDRKDLAGTKAEIAADAQKDGGIALVNLGYAYVTYGQYDRGIALMERGLAKGLDVDDNNRRPQDARLHMAIAFLAAGKPDRARALFGEVRGAHGAADMARLWSIHASRAQGT